MAIQFEPRIPFYKMQGSGNDFVLVIQDQLPEEPQNMSQWAELICKSSFAVGADGVIFLKSTPEDANSDLRWDFYNADGSRAEMCGNGSRCAAALAYALGLAPAELTIKTDAGPVKSQVFAETWEVMVQLTQPQELQTYLDLQLSDASRVEVHHVNTGVPQVILISQEARRENIAKLGPELRYHRQFSPQGTNVNILERLDLEHIFLRTYERGVEDETYACGTGAAASAYIAYYLGLCEENVEVTTSGGEKLKVLLKDNTLFLQGKAHLIYRGELNPRAIGLF